MMIEVLFLTAPLIAVPMAISLASLRAVRGAAARTFLAISSISLLAGMLLAATYAIGEFRETLAPTIPFMAAAHGTLLALGFSIGGLAGRLVERRPASAPSAVTDAATRAPAPLRLSHGKETLP